MIADLDWQALTQLEFLWPWAIALLPLPWLVRQLLPPAPRQAPLQAPTLVETARKAVRETPEKLHRHRVRRLPIPLWAWFLWTLLVISAMRPVWYATPTPFTQQGKNIMLAVDLSGSMEKPDMRLGGQAVDRLTVVKTVVEDFVGQRKHDRIGLVVFGSRAFLISPLTYDHATLLRLLKESQIGMAGDNTAIGDAIGIAFKHLRHVPGDPVLILLTDGANTDGEIQPLEAAREAGRQGLKIYTIALGRSAGMGGGYDYDEQTLRKIAQLTGGRFYLARNPDQLRQIYAEINRLETVPYDIHSLRTHTELFIWPLGVVLLVTLLIGWRRGGNGWI